MKKLRFIVARAALLGSFAATLPCMAGDAEQQLAVSKLRTFCGACHGIGRLRFLWSDDDSEVWNYLYTNKAPNSGKIWNVGITEVLNWPSDAPPPFDKEMDPINHLDWMPKGAKRLDLAADRTGSESTRAFLLRMFRN